MKNNKLKYLKFAHAITGSNVIETLITVSEKIRQYVENGTAPSLDEGNVTISDFLKKMVVYHPTKGLIPFIPFDFQQRYFDKLIDSKGDPVVIATSRQMGLTNCLAFYALFEAMTKPNQNILIFSSSTIQAGAVLECMKPFLFSTVGIANIRKNAIEFENGSKITVRPISPSHLDGQPPTHILIDNAAYISYKSLSDFLENIRVKMIIERGAKLVVQSTPRFAEGPFYKMWIDEQNIFTRLRFDWLDHPARGDDWADKMRQTMGELAFTVEHEARFITRISEPTSDI